MFYDNLIVFMYKNATHRYLKDVKKIRVDIYFTFLISTDRYLLLYLCN